jgi:hypothetical protein
MSKPDWHDAQTAGDFRGTVTSAVWYVAPLTTEQVARGHLRLIQRLFAEAVGGANERRGACLFAVNGDASADRLPVDTATAAAAAGCDAVFFSPASIALVPHLIALYDAQPGPAPERAQAVLLVGYQDDWDLLPQPHH